MYNIKFTSWIKLFSIYLHYVISFRFGATRRYFHWHSYFETTNASLRRTFRSLISELKICLQVKIYRSLVCFILRGWQRPETWIVLSSSEYYLTGFAKPLHANSKQYAITAQSFSASKSPSYPKTRFPVTRSFQTWRISHSLFVTNWNTPNLVIWILYNIVRMKYLNRIFLYFIIP